MVVGSRQIVLYPSYICETHDYANDNLDEPVVSHPLAASQPTARPGIVQRYDDAMTAEYYALRVLLLSITRAGSPSGVLRGWGCRSVATRTVSPRPDPFNLAPPGSGTPPGLRSPRDPFRLPRSGFVQRLPSGCYRLGALPG